MPWTFGDSQLGASRQQTHLVLCGTSPLLNVNAIKIILCRNGGDCVDELRSVCSRADVGREELRTGPSTDRKRRFHALCTRLVFFKGTITSDGSHILVRGGDELRE